MVQIVLEDDAHTFDASAKTITLAAPYTALSLGQVVSIIDLTTNDVLYSAVTQRTDMISVAGAVITHTHGNSGQADSDLLQVIIDIGTSSTPLLVAAGVGVSTPKDGRKTVTTPGTAVPLTATATPILEVTITAETDNTDIVVIGASTVVAALSTRRGIPLYPGDSVTLAVDDLADIYEDAIVAGEGVSFVYTEA